MSARTAFVLAVLLSVSAQAETPPPELRTVAIGWTYSHGLGPLQLQTELLLADRLAMGVNLGAIYTPIFAAPGVARTSGFSATVLARYHFWPRLSARTSSPYAGIGVFGLATERKQDGNADLVLMASPFVDVGWEWWLNHVALRAGVGGRLELNIGGHSSRDGLFPHLDLGVAYFFGP